MTGWRADFFCSECCPRWTILQRPQGCLPSKVFATASVSGVDWEKINTMPTQATDCSKAQCRPSESESATTSTILGNRKSTGD